MNDLKLLDFFVYCDTLFTDVSRKKFGLVNCSLRYSRKLVQCVSIRGLMDTNKNRRPNNTVFQVQI